MNNEKMVSVPFKALRDFLEHSACTYKGPEWTKNKAALRHAMSAPVEPSWYEHTLRNERGIAIRTIIADHEGPAFGAPDVDYDKIFSVSIEPLYKVKAPEPEL